MVAATCAALAVAARPALGRLLDDERPLAGADCLVAGARLRRSGIESARRSLFRPNGFVLDRSSVVQHMAGLLHRGVSSASAHAAGSLRRATNSHYTRMFRFLSSHRPGPAMDARRATGGSRDY